MTETEANLWLMSMRECLHADREEMSEEVYSQFNDILRFLEEFCCPSGLRTPVSEWDSGSVPSADRADMLIAIFAAMGHNQGRNPER